MKILLFDIDGTLIDSGGAGSRALEMAFSEVCSLDNALNGLTLAGKTDPQILTEALQSNNIPYSDKLLGRLMVSYIHNLKGQIITADMSLKPGVASLLESLRDNAHEHMGLLTGNIAEGARIKLEPLGIYDFFLSEHMGATMRTGTLSCPMRRKDTRK